MAEVTMRQRLEAICASSFPYVCTGRKVEHADGSVSCECGDKTVTPEEFRSITGEPKA